MQKTQKTIAIILIALLTLVNAMPSLSFAADAVQDAKTSEENVEFSAVFEKVAPEPAEETKETNAEPADEESKPAETVSDAVENNDVNGETSEGQEKDETKTEAPAESSNAESSEEKNSTETSLKDSIASGAVSGEAQTTVKSEQAKSAEVAEEPETNSEMSADLTEKVNLKLTIKVLNTGYLKDATIEIANNNYAISNIASEYIKEINGSTLVLNQINAGTEAVITLPISLPQTENVQSYVFNNTSKITLNATYVNEKGKDKKVSKEQSLKLAWTRNDAKEAISQNIVRNLKYDQTKTMLTFEVSEGIVDNTIPVQSKEISIVVPQINKTLPSKVIFSEDGYESEYKDGTLKITNKNEADQNGNIVWNSNKKFLVTYIYDTQTSDKEIETTANSKVVTYDGKTLEANAENTKFNIESEVGNIVEIDAATDENISKGYMYTNLDAENKLETPYQENLTVDFGSSEIIDKVVVEEKEITLPVVTNSISVDANKLTKLLGDAGTITVINAETNEELGKLTKDVATLDLTEKKPAKVRLETSAPVAEGTIKINIAKAISKDSGLTKDQIIATNKLTTSINIKGSKEDTEISNKDVTAESNITEPSTSVTIDASQDTLSTVVENKNIVFDIILNSKTIENRLFENPTLKLTLPSEIKQAKVTDAQVLYSDELKPATASIDGNTLTLTLTGKQTKYTESALTNGTLVRVTTDLTLDDLAPSSEEQIKLEYTNAADGSTGVATKNIEIVAPTGFVTENKITNAQGETATAIESTTENVDLIDHASTEQELNIEGTIVNNLGEDANGVTVVGVIPTEGNKSQTGEDLGTNVNTSLKGAITTQGLDDAKVYYSEDKDAKSDSDSWTENVTENTKAYKITSSKPLTAKSKASFAYKVSVPANVDYEKNANQTYGVYYNNNAEQGTTTNLVEAKAAGASTGSLPVVQMSVSVADTNEGYAISENSSVTERQGVTYRVKVTNNGSETAKNIKVTMNIPENGLAFIAKDSKTGDETVIADTSRTETIDELKAGESKYVSFKTVVLKYYDYEAMNNGTYSEMSNEEKEQRKKDASKITATYNLTYDNAKENSNAAFTLNRVDGTLTAQLASYSENSKIASGDTVKVSLGLGNGLNEEQKNIVTTLAIPNGFDYQSVSGDGKASYDDKSRVLTINVDKIKANDAIVIDIMLKANDNVSDNMKINATVKSDKLTDELKTNTIAFNAAAGVKGISVTHTTSLTTGGAQDKDTFNVYIDIKNGSGQEQTLNFEENIPEQLQVKEYKVTVDGKEVANGDGSLIKTTIIIPADKSARIIETIKPQTLDNGESQTYTLAPSLSINESKKDIEVPSLSIKVNGTGEVSVDNGTYTIAGVVFEDANNNGKIDEGEQKFKGITVMLFNPSTSQIAKDSNGNEYKTTTGDDGAYSFTNLPRGNYIVVAQYDNTKYGVGLYKVPGVDEAENNDFITSKLNNQEVGSTDTINLSQNEYNINLGLVSKNTFDLALDKVVTKITVANSKNGTKVYNYNNEKTAKVELSSKNIANNTVLIEYKISITNKGKVAGYADSIVDYLPEGLTFNADLNKDWYLKDKNVYNQSLANTLINPGETKDLTLVLQRHITGEDTGTFNNIAEIASSYNELSIKDINSTAGNKQDGENDQSNAVTVILMSTGREALQVTGIMIGLVALIGLAVFELKKHVIAKNI